MGADLCLPKTLRSSAKGTLGLLESIDDVTTRRIILIGECANVVDVKIKMKQRKVLSIGLTVIR